MGAADCDAKPKTRPHAHSYSFEDGGPEGFNLRAGSAHGISISLSTPEASVFGASRAASAVLERILNRLGKVVTRSPLTQSITPGWSPGSIKDARRRKLSRICKVAT